MSRFGEPTLNHYLYGYNTVRLATEKEIDAELAARESSFPQQSPRSGGQSQQWRLPKAITMCISGIPGSTLGICTIQAVPKGTWFGPFEGKLIRKDSHLRATSSEFMWEVFRNGNVSHYVDGKDVLSWMSYVRCARHTREQNLAMFQYRGCIYYRALSDIPAGKELLVWYDEKYTQMLGLPLVWNEAKVAPRDPKFLSPNTFPMKYKGRQACGASLLPKRRSPFNRQVLLPTPKIHQIDALRFSEHRNATHPGEDTFNENAPHVIRISTNSRLRDIESVDSLAINPVVFLDQKSNAYGSRHQAIDINHDNQYHYDNGNGMPIISSVVSCFSKT